MSKQPPDARLGFGVVAHAEPISGDLAVLGGRLELLGYDELWANDGRDRSGLATLATAGGSATRLLLGVGVVPLSEKSPAMVAADVERVGIPRTRSIVGVGTGDGSSLAAVRSGVAELRALLPDTQLCVAALGPRMCRLAGEIADVVLLNWAFPERIAWSRARVAEGAAMAGRPTPRVAAYVRVAVGPDGGARLRAEADRYRRRPRPYARLFAEQEAAEAKPPGVAARSAVDVPDLLAAYREALDSCVVRALPVGESVDELLEIAEAAVSGGRGT